MLEPKIENVICETLTDDAQINALHFVKYLRTNDVVFERGKGYWEDKPYWMITYKDEYVCFIFIHGSPVKYIDEPEGWILWSDDSDLNWYADAPIGERAKEIAWENVDICGKCSPSSPCYSGSRKTIFGKEFDNVCRTTFRFDNPDSEAVECVKKLLELRKNDIEKNHYLDRIEPLDGEKWQGYRLEFHYISHNYYDAEINRSDSGFHVSFIKKPYDTPFEHMPSDTDKLFQPWWDDIKAWGIEENGKLIAVIETAVEEWSNRLRVTELWIDDVHRRKGIGTALMDIAIKRAKDEKCRILMLETQSRNDGAIAFYLAYGFSLIGFDACAYGNDDLSRKEVRMELGIYL